MALTVLANLAAGSQPLSIIDANFAQCCLGAASSTNGGFVMWSGTSGKQLSATSFAFTPSSATLGADVSLANSGIYYDGPSVPQGSTGGWYASGTVTVTDSSAGPCTFYAKLWDGTNVISSAAFASQGSSTVVSCTLSGFITNPAGNLRISVRDTTSTNGKILFNSTGNSADSAIWAFRVA